MPKRSHEETLKSIRIIGNFCEKYDLLYAMCDTDEKKEKFKNAYRELSNNWNKSINHIMNTPLVTKKPISEIEAAYLGTIVGGSAVGLVAAQKVKEQNDKHYETLSKSTKEKIKFEECFDIVINKYNECISILNTCPKYISYLNKTQEDKNVMKKI